MKKIKKTIKELNKTPRGKAILFFGFYLVFFLLLGVLHELGKSNYSMRDEFPKEPEKTYYSIKLFQEANYQFMYTISVDGVSYVYQGSKNKDKEVFSFQGADYYRDDALFYQHQDTWKEAENPYVWEDFWKSNSLVELLSNAYYESKTIYESGKTNYRFLISSNLINQLLYQTNTDFFEEPNIITVSTNEDNEMTGVTLDLDHYCEHSDACVSQLKMNISFEGFGTVGEINPMKE